MLVRKIGAPGDPELGLGAVIDGADPQIVVNEDVTATLEVPASYIVSEARRQLTEIERRRQMYLGARGAVELRNRTVILVADGIATGGR